MYQLYIYNTKDKEKINTLIYYIVAITNRLGKNSHV